MNKPETKLTFTGVTVIDVDLIKYIDPTGDYSWENEGPHYYISGVPLPVKGLEDHPMRRSGFFGRVAARDLAPILFPEVK